MDDSTSEKPVKEAARSNPNGKPELFNNLLRFYFCLILLKITCIYSLNSLSCPPE